MQPLPYGGTQESASRPTPATTFTPTCALLSPLGTTTSTPRSPDGLHALELVVAGLASISPSWPVVAVVPRSEAQGTSVVMTSVISVGLRQLAAAHTAATASPVTARRAFPIEEAYTAGGRPMLRYDGGVRPEA